MSSHVLSILYITVRSDRSGGPQHLSDLISNIKLIKGEIDLKISVASPLEAPFGPIFKNIADHFIEIPTRRFSIIKALQLLAHVRKHNILIIHSHGRGAGLYSRFLKIFGNRVIHTFHGIHLEPTLVGRFKYYVDKLISGLTDCFICVSHDEKESVLNRKLAPNDKIRIVQNGVDVKRIDLACDSCTRESVRDAFKIDQRAFVCGTLTRLDHVKGIDLLLQFAHEYFLKYPNSNIKFYIVGEGKGYDDYLDMQEDLQLKNRVIFIGSSDKPINFLKAIDCYVSFSRWEGLPLSVLEAMTCSLPCILTDVTGHRELVSSSSGALFPINDVDKFIKILHTLSTHIGAAEELGANARQKILKEYTVTQMSQKTLSVYLSL